MVTNMWQDFQDVEESVSINCQVWEEENPHGTRHQRQSFLNVWTEIAGDTFVGSYFLLPCLTGAVYLCFLQLSFQRYSKMFTYSLRIHLRFMHQGALPHFVRAVYAFSNNIFPEQWTGQG
jgi:hypothetical protein